MTVIDATISRSGGGDRPGKDRAATYLYLAIECDRPLEPSRRFSLAGLSEVTIGRGPGPVHAEHRAEDPTRLAIQIPDRRVSSEHARLVRDLGRWVLEDAGSKNGVVVNGVAHRRVLLSDGDLIELGRTLFLLRENQQAPSESKRLPELEGLGLATMAPDLQELFAALDAVARSAVTVLVQGESGTGKERIARAVHKRSGRTGPFVAINCGALAPNLVESELFGYRKGAFSGAAEDHSGLVRSAHGGTLFLDEIGELPLAAQPSLLRVLQEHEVLPLGATRPIPVDLRLVAATNRDLRQAIDAAAFRTDLYARLLGFSLVLPPLRERREDLGSIIASLIRQLAKERAAGITFSVEAMRALFRYAWPLNIRELLQCLSAAVAVADGGRIELHHLQVSVRPASQPADAPAPAPLSPEDARLRDELSALLQQHGGNVSAVARAMGKARMQIQRWIKRFQLDGTRLGK
jgi:transcriptional regulator with GAF, ATPase, and Fis domain